MGLHWFAERTRSAAAPRTELDAAVRRPLKRVVLHLVIAATKSTPALLDRRDTGDASSDFDAREMLAHVIARW